MNEFERYRAGEHAAVCRELTDEATPRPAHDAVARLLMKRVRENLETLAERWRAEGFTLADPLGQRGAARASVSRLEAQRGPLPATLRAFYHELGFVNFVESPPGAPWPEDEDALDPIAIASIEEAIDEENLDGAEGQLFAFLDPLLKFEMGGVGAFYLEAKPCFDPTFVWEEKPMRDPASGEPVRLLTYLRTTILRQGGIGMFAPDTVKLAPKLLGKLTAGLLEF